MTRERTNKTVYYMMDQEQAEKERIRQDCRGQDFAGMMGQTGVLGLDI